MNKVDWKLVFINGQLKKLNGNKLNLMEYKI